MFGQRLMSNSEDLLLLRGELFVREHTLFAELFELLQLRDVGGFVGLGWRSRAGLLLHGLLIPHGALLLSAAHAPGNGGSGSRDNCGRGRCTHEVHAWSSASRRHLSFLPWS